MCGRLEEEGGDSEESGETGTGTGIHLGTLVRNGEVTHRELKEDQERPRPWAGSPKGAQGPDLGPALCSTHTGPQRCPQDPTASWPPRLLGLQSSTPRLCLNWLCLMQVMAKRVTRGGGRGYAMGFEGPSREVGVWESGEGTGPGATSESRPAGA